MLSATGTKGVNNSKKPNAVDRLSVGRLSGLSGPKVKKNIGKVGRGRYGDRL